MNVWPNPTQRLQPFERLFGFPPVVPFGGRVEVPLCLAPPLCRAAAAGRRPRVGRSERAGGVGSGGRGSRSSGGSRKDRDVEARPVRRTCTGCGGEAARDELIRCVLLESQDDTPAQVIVDLRGTLEGRGAWVHPRRACFEQAVRRGLARSFRQRVQASAEALLEQLQLQATRRVQGLLLSARARGGLVFGLDKVKQHAGRAALVLVGEDARALTKDRMVQQWAQSGKVTLWSTKQEYGHLLGRGEVGILAVLDATIATAITRMISLTRLRAPAQSAGGDAHLLSEVR